MPKPSPSAAPSTLSLYDGRAFFEKALLFGLQHGIIDQHKLDAICSDAPKGMVQIARYFGSEYLRPELEKARDRIINLVSLYLESSSGGDLRIAAESLRENSFLSHSKAGSDMLKALIAMPQNSHFGMNERSGFTNDRIPLLAKWSLRSLADYQAELAKCSQVAQLIDAAIWLADHLGMEAAELQDAGQDAEAVVRTTLLILATKRTELPDWVAFENMIGALRKKHGSANDATNVRSKVVNSAGTGTLPIIIPKNLPSHLKIVVEAVRQSVVADLPRILDATVPVRKLLCQTPAFIGRYFWVEDGLSEVDHYDRATSDVWTKATGGHSDDSSLLTLFLCIAAEAAPKTILTEKSAAVLIRRIRKTGLKPDLVRQYIQDLAPEQHQDDYATLWMDFILDAQATLQSDLDYALNDAVTLLRRECNVT
jgi:hypothetical protein